MFVNIRKYIPNCFTFLNLSLGFIAMLAGTQNDLKLGSLLVLLAGILDRLDGKMARKLDAVSDLGKQLDSLSDLVSFGVAPALLCWSLNFTSYKVLGILLVTLFVVCGAFRLARFNVTDQVSEFMGIPITVAGCLLALDNLFSLNYGTHPQVTVFFILFLSYLMISKFRIKKV